MSCRAGDNAQRSGAGWVSPRDKLHGRVVERRRVVEMARTIIAIRRLTDEVTTLEGLAHGRLRQAWLDEQVPQCGYCQPGQLMSAAVLLARTPHSTDAEIDDAMAGNLCRCDTYQRIRRAIHRAAQAGSAKP